MWTIRDIRKEMNRLDKISGMDTSNIPIRTSGRMTKTLGQCRYIYNSANDFYHVKEFTFSTILMNSATEEHFLDTVRHEYAHAYNVIKEHAIVGHGPKWKAAAIRFGASPSACCSHSELSEQVRRNKKYIVECGNCKHEFYYTARAGIVQKLLQDENATGYRCPYCNSKKFILHKPD